MALYKCDFNVIILVVVVVVVVDVVVILRAFHTFENSFSIWEQSIRWRS